MDITKETREELDNARDIENLKRVEAALFVSGKFLSAQELVALTDLNPILLNQALQALQEKYNGGSAVEIVNKGELWKMDVKNEYMDIVNRLASGSEEFTKAEQETLAVIAHKNPITQSKIVQMRGNKSYDHIKKFLSLGLIKGKKAGRTKELSLSNEFYDYFNVNNKPLEKVSKTNDKPLEKVSKNGGENEPLEGFRKGSEKEPNLKVQGTEPNGSKVSKDEEESDAEVNDQADEEN